ncbi:trypsin-like peptidase domain-containing protein [Saccharothrix sp. S26]|uniref:nSTAND1 domain-containing NTPase n=1 Tax=Saccharothrix sp. S26 TaxID=2907215 RepID=UPI001F33D8DC|nr:trypsin-like peptidase domain-containing protein [Saccharothrix sp. S26]MCE6995569.1 trypsin-like peptidase domain-containing protein [Saccharothrix sp. S26]
MGSARALPAAVVRVRDGRGLVVGAGFLVAPDLVCTCAHVVGDGPVPPERVVVDFPMLPGVPTRTARVEAWRPAEADGRGDIALLRLTAPPPEGSAALALGAAENPPLGAAENPWGQRFRVPGFPAGHEDGLWVGGGLRERQGTGWVQMQADDGPRIVRGFSGSPVWSEDLDAVIGMTVAAERGSGTAYLIPSEALVEVTGALAPPCPFRGLRAFRAEDARYFFGRDEEVDRLAERVARHRVVLVVGPSGCGKSSLVDAGLRPRLEAAGTPVAVVRPAPGQTAAELLAVLGAVAVPGAVLVIDQFEEVVTSDPGTARDVLRLLDELTAAPDGPRVVLTLRAGSLDGLLAAGGVPALDDATVFVEPLTGDRLRQAVERPVSLTPGVAYQDGVVDRVLADARSGTGLLPLVEFTLTELWHAQEAGRLTLRAYDRLGGVAGALAGHAERFYRGLDPAEREPARRLLVRLARPTEDGFALRPTRLDEVPDELRRAVDVLLGARLLVVREDPGQPRVVAPAHEALLHNWRTLRGWLEADREFLSWHAQLRERAEQWEREGRDRSLVPRGGQLATARQWLDQRSADVDRREHEYVAAGLTAQRRSTRTRRAAVAAMAVLLLVSALLTARTVSANQELDTTVRRQAAQLLHDLAERESAISASSALQFALASWRQDPAVGYGALLRQQAVFHDVAEVDVDRFAAPMDVVATTPSGDVAVSATAAGALTAWREPWGDTPRSWPLGEVDGAPVIRVSDDGTTVAVADNAAAIRVWDLRERGEPVLVRPGGPVAGPEPLDDAALAISPSGGHVVLVDDGAVEVWDVARRSRVTGFAQPQRAVVLGVAALDENATVALVEARDGGVVHAVRALDTGAEARSTPGVPNVTRQGRLMLRCAHEVLAGVDVFSGAEVFRRDARDCLGAVTDLTGRYVVLEPDRESGGFGLVTYLDPRDGRAYQSWVPGSELAGPRQFGDGTVVLRSPGGTPDIRHVRGQAMLRMRPPRPVEQVGSQQAAYAGTSDLANPAYSADGSLMALVDGGGVDGSPGLSLIDTRTRRRLAHAPQVLPPGRLFLEFTPDDARLLLFDGPELVVLDTRDLAEVRRIRLPRPAELDGQDDRSWLSTAAVVGDRTAVTLHAGLLARWDLDSGSPIGEPLRVGDTARDLLAAAERGRVLRTPDPERVLVNTPYAQRWWDLRTRVAGDRFAPEPDPAMLAAAPRLPRIAIQYASGRAYVHDLESGGTSGPISLTADAAPIGFTPDGKLVASGKDELIQVWDPTTARLLGEFRLPDDTVRPVVVGSRLIGANKHGFVSLDLDPSRWFTTLCAVAGRDYTPSEVDRLPAGVDRGNPCA